MATVGINRDFRPNQGTVEERIYLWDVNSGSVLRSFVAGQGFDDIGEMIFTPDSETLIVAQGTRESGRAAQLWDVETGLKRGVLKNSEGQLSNMKFSPDGQSLVAHLVSEKSRSSNPIAGEMSRKGRQDDFLGIWDLASGDVKRILRDANLTMDSEFALSPDAAHLAIAEESGAVKIYDLAFGKFVETHAAHGSYIQEIVPSLSTATIATRDIEGHIRLWNWESGELERPLEQPQAFNKGVPEVLVSSDSRVMVFSEDGRYIAVSCDDFRVRVWDVASRKLKRTIANARGELEFSPDGEFLLVTSAENVFDGTAQLCNISTGAVRIFGTRSRRSPIDGYESLGFSADGRYLALMQPGKYRSENDRMLKVWLWDVRRLWMVKGYRPITLAVEIPFASASDPLLFGLASIVAASFSADGNHVAITVSHPPSIARFAGQWNFQLTIFVWDILKRKLESRVEPPSTLKPISFEHCCALSPHGDTVALALNADPVFLWDVRNSAWKGWLPGDGKSLESVEFSSDGHYIMANAEEESPRFWNAETFRQLMLPTSAMSSFVDWPRVQKSQWVYEHINNRNLRNGRIEASGSKVQLFADQNRLLAELIALPGTTGGWAVVTPEGYFEGSQGAAKYLVDDGKPLANYATKLYNREFVRKALRGEAIPRGEKGVAPQVQFTDQMHNLKWLSGNHLDLEFYASDDQEIAGCKVFVNGVPVQTAAKVVQKFALSPRSQAGADRRVPLAYKNNFWEPKGNDSNFHTAGTIFRVPIDLKADQPDFRFDVSVFDNDGNEDTVSLEKSRPGTTIGTSGNLYVIALGISAYRDPLNDAGVRFAASDATEFANFFRSQEGVLYDRVQTYPLLDQEASLENVRKVIGRLKGEIQDNDTVIVFLAGHGEENHEGNFFFGTHDMDKERLETTALSANELKQAFDGLPATVQRFLFADVCLAGKIGLDRPSDYLQNRLNLHGVVGLGATSAVGDAYEDEVHKHGNFTQALLEGLRGAACREQKGRRVVSWIGLANYVTYEVNRRQPGQDVTVLAGSRFPAGVPIAILTR